MSVIRFLFWFLFPSPLIGDTLVHMDDLGDPWNQSYYTIIGHWGNWYRLRHNGTGLEMSKPKQILIAFYRPYKQ
jgi:hypothetical protein